MFCFFFPVSLSLEQFDGKRFIFSIHKGESEEGALALEMANVEGVFYVLIGGVFVAIIFAFIAVIFETRRVCNENEVCSFSEKF